MIKQTCDMLWKEIQEVVAPNANKGRQRDKNFRKQDKNVEPKDKSLDSDVFYEKLDAKKRLEREKKIKRKKDQADEIVNNKKSKNTNKKMKNIDWTKGYEGGLFDDDNFYDEFMK